MMPAPLASDPPPAPPFREAPGAVFRIAYLCNIAHTRERRLQRAAPEHWVAEVLDRNYYNCYNFLLVNRQLRNRNYDNHVNYDNFCPFYPMTELLSSCFRTPFLNNLDEMFGGFAENQYFCSNFD